MFVFRVYIILVLVITSINYFSFEKDMVNIVVNNEKNLRSGVDYNSLLLVCVKI